MVTLGGVILAIEFIVFLIAIPIAVLVVRKLSEETATGDTLVICRDSSKCDGKVIGNLISKTVQNGRLIIEYMSRDSEENEPIRVAVEPSNVISYPKGVWSEEKAILEILPNSAKDYINNILTKIELEKAENSIIAAQKEGLARQKMHLRDMGEGEISGINLGLNKDFVEQTLRAGSKDDKTPKPGSYQRADSFGP